MSELPMVVPMAGLPESVTIWEVGARDGLQNESAVISTAAKIEFIDRLAAVGLPVVEATSMVRPEWVPQLADAPEVLAGITRRPGVRYPVLVPNPKGLARAREAGTTDIAVFASATESFAAKNLNRTLSSQWDMFEPTIDAAVAAGMAVRGYVSMCFGDPWEGSVDPQQVVDVCLRLHRAGCSAISLGDTIGVATPGQVRDLIGRLDAGGAAAGLHRGALPRHVRPGPGQHPGRAGRGRGLRRRQRRRPGRLPLRQVRHRQPCHRGPGVDA